MALILTWRRTLPRPPSCTLRWAPLSPGGPAISGVAVQSLGERSGLPSRRQTTSAEVTDDLTTHQTLVCIAIPIAREQKYAMRQFVVADVDVVTEWRIWRDHAVFVVVVATVLLARPQEARRERMGSYNVASAMERPFWKAVVRVVGLWRVVPRGSKDRSPLMFRCLGNGFAPLLHLGLELLLWGTPFWRPRRLPTSTRGIGHSFFNLHSRRRP